MVDYFQGAKPTACEYTGAALITPDDDNDQPNVYPALKIGATGGALKVTPFANADDDPVTLNVAANEVLKLAVKRVWSTGTVATTITGLF